jgi:aminopeptidase N
MRPICLALALLISTTALTQLRIDVTHYRFSIDLNDQNDTIYGKADIVFTANADLDTVELDLSNLNSSGKGMTVTKIVKGDQGPAHLYRQAPEKLSISKSVRKGDIDSVTIFYKGIPADGLIIAKSRFGRRTIFSDNWPNRGHHWLPCVDDVADKASVEFIVTAPRHYGIVSNGILVDESDLKGSLKRSHWREDIPLPTKIMVIGVADFAVREEGETHGIPVSTWVFPENKEAGFFDYAPARDVLSFFIDYFGPYPYKKLANVQSMTLFGGMENASAIFYNQNYVNGHRDQYTLMAHEITHQWFGDMVSEKKFGHLWLSEGFANYFSIVYMQHKFGVDTALEMLEDDRAKAIAFSKKNSSPVVDTISSYLDLLNANSYEKGCWVLRMLHHQLGDSVFKTCIRNYYKTFAGKNADSRDFQQICEKVSGLDLSVFFQQWLYTPGIPNLHISWKYLARDKKINITVRQSQKTPFVFPLEILAEDRGKKGQLATLKISRNIQTFSIPIDKKPAKLIADPQRNLLFEGNVKEEK